MPAGTGGSKKNDVLLKMLLGKKEMGPSPGEGPPNQPRKGWSLPKTAKTAKNGVFGGYDQSPYRYKEK